MPSNPRTGTLLPRDRRGAADTTPAEEPAAVPLLDLKAQYRTIRPQVEEAVRRVLESQQCVLGAEVAAFEEELAAYAGCRHATGVASGSDALLLSLMALDVGPGDEVLTTPFTFFATGAAVARLGARPVFVDIEPRAYTLDVGAAEDYLRGRHPVLNDRGRFDHDPRRVKAILPVHLYGQCADMGPLLDLARGRAVPVVEDAAQALGACYRDRPAGTMGALGCFSFYPTKNLGGAGDGGAVVTDDDRLAERVRVLRVHGARQRYYHAVIGLNSRLDALQAAVLRVKLPYLDRWNAARRALADRYDELLHDLPGLTLPWRRGGDQHTFHQYVIATERREGVRAALQGARVGHEVYYPLPLHLQECFGYLGYRAGDLPRAEAAAQRALALPMYPELQAGQQQRAADVIRRCVTA